MEICKHNPKYIVNQPETYFSGANTFSYRSHCNVTQLCIESMSLFFVDNGPDWIVVDYGLCSMSVTLVTLAQ